MKTKKGFFTRFGRSILALGLILLTALMVFCCDNKQNTSAKNATAAPAKIDFFEGTGPKTLRLYQTDYTVIDYYEKWIKDCEPRSATDWNLIFQTLLSDI